MQLSKHKTNVYIISSQQDDLDLKENHDVYEALKDGLRVQGVRFDEAEGRFKGKIEKSLILFGTHKIIAHHFSSVNHQECFLKLEPHQGNMFKAFSVDVMTGDEKPIGYFRSFEKQVVDALGLDYTKDSNGTYFSVWYNDNTDMVTHLEEIGTELLGRIGQ